MDGKSTFTKEERDAIKAGILDLTVKTILYRSGAPPTLGNLITRFWTYALYTPTEAAGLLSVSVGSVHRMIRSGALAAKYVEKPPRPGWKICGGTIKELLEARHMEIPKELKERAVARAGFLPDAQGNIDEKSYYDPYEAEEGKWLSDSKWAGWTGASDSEKIRGFRTSDKSTMSRLPGKEEAGMPRLSEEEERKWLSSIDPEITREAQTKPHKLNWLRSKYGLKVKAERGSKCAYFNPPKKPKKEREDGGEKEIIDVGRGVHIIEKPHLARPRALWQSEKTVAYLPFKPKPVDDNFQATGRVEPKKQKVCVTRYGPATTKPHKSESRVEPSGDRPPRPITSKQERDAIDFIYWQTALTEALSEGDFLQWENEQEELQGFILYAYFRVTSGAISTAIPDGGGACRSTRTVSLTVAEMGRLKGGARWHDVVKDYRGRMPTPPQRPQPRRGLFGLGQSQTYAKIDELVERLTPAFKEHWRDPDPPDPPDEK